MTEQERSARGSLGWVVMVGLSVGAAGCPAGAGDDDDLGPPPDFVGDSELTQYLFSNFDDPDPVKMQQGVQALAEQLATVDLSGPLSGRRWDDGALLTQEFYGGATIWPDADPLDQVTISVAGRSAFDSDAHASLVPLEDQTPLESASSAAYNRTLLSDSGCFLAHSCPTLRTLNEVHRDNPLLDVWYETPKDFRWIELSDGGFAMVARAWLERDFVGESGVNTIEQFTALELKIDSDDGAILHTTVWGAVRPALDGLVVRNTTANGIEEAWGKTDELLAE